jgi:hypothetical protein
MRRLLLFALILFVILSVGNFGFAQDITPEPTSTPTETPFFTETPSPTATLTETTTATLTETPALTNTAFFTETATETPFITETPTETALFTETATATAFLTETPSLTPAETLSAGMTETATATPSASATVPTTALSLAFTADFESPDLSAWTFDSGWAFHPVATGQALRVYNSQTPFVLNQTYADVAAEAQFIVDYAAAHLTVRQTFESWYEVSLDASGFVTLYRMFEVVGQTMVAPSLPEQWRTLRLSAIGNVVTVFVDGSEVLSYTDATPLPAGQISFHATFPPQPEGFVPVPPQNTMVVDNFMLWTPTVLAATPTSTWTPEPSLTPVTALPTFTAAPDNTVWTEVYRESFDIPFSLESDMPLAGTRIEIDGNPALQTRPNNRATAIFISVQDVFFELRGRLGSNGKLALMLRGGETGSYIAQIDTTGAVTLYRNGELLGSGLASGIQPDQWFNMQFIARGDQLRLAVNNSEVLVVNDSGILNAGIIAFSGTNAFVDDLMVSTAPPLDVAQPPLAPMSMMSEEQPLGMMNTGDYVLNPYERLMYSDGGKIKIHDGTTAVDYIYSGMTLIDITTLTGVGRNFAWSDDYGYLAFECYTATGQDICVAEVDQYRQILSIRNITNTPNYYEFLGNWNNDNDSLIWIQAESFVTDVNSLRQIPLNTTVKRGFMSEIEQGSGGGIFTISLEVEPDHWITSAFLGDDGYIYYAMDGDNYIVDENYNSLYRGGIYRQLNGQPLTRELWLDNIEIGLYLSLPYSADDISYNFWISDVEDNGKVLFGFWYEEIVETGGEPFSYGIWRSSTAYSDGQTGIFLNNQSRSSARFGSLTLQYPNNTSTAIVIQYSPGQYPEDANPLQNVSVNLPTSIRNAVVVPWNPLPDTINLKPNETLFFTESDGIYRSNGLTTELYIAPGLQLGDGTTLAGIGTLQVSFDGRYLAFECEVAEGLQGYWDICYTEINPIGSAGTVWRQTQTANKVEYLGSWSPTNYELVWLEFDYPNQVHDRSAERLIKRANVTDPAESEIVTLTTPEYHIVSDIFWATDGYYYYTVEEDPEQPTYAGGIYRQSVSNLTAPPEFVALDGYMTPNGQLPVQTTWGKIEFAINDVRAGDGVLYEAYSQYNTAAGTLRYYQLGLAQLNDVAFPIIRKTNAENDDITLLYEATFGREGDIYILDRAAGTTFRATTLARLLQQLLWFLLNIPFGSGGGSQPMSMMAQGDNMLQPMQNGTPTPVPAGIKVAQANFICLFDVSEYGGIRVRSTPSQEGVIVAENALYVEVLGRFHNPDGSNFVWNDAEPTTPETFDAWVYVNIQGGYQGGWVPSFQFWHGRLVFIEARRICSRIQDNARDVPPVDVTGNLIPESPTPTPTATPVLTPGPLFPTTAQLTPFPGPAPGELCSTELSVANRAWLKTVCNQGWSYLSETERDVLTAAIAQNNTVVDTYIKADTWWLTNTTPKRGINDVPPAFWGIPCPTGDTGICQHIVSGANYLFDNMTRIGVDTDNGAGAGQQTVYSNGTQGSGDYIEGFLPLPTDPIVESWGRRESLDQNTIGLFACGRNRLTSELASVCWVCQDLPTELYRYAGYDLLSDMTNYPKYQSTDWDEPYVEKTYPSVLNSLSYISRNVVPVQDFVNLTAGGKIDPGGQLNYQVGDQVLLINPSLIRFHTGIVVRGASSSDFNSVLDQVLIAQISFSSQGFFKSNSDLFYLSPSTGETFTNDTPVNFAGRFEVITLRTYLYKAILGYQEFGFVGVIVQGSDDVNAANLYLEIVRPGGLDISQ